MREWDEGTNSSYEDTDVLGMYCVMFKNTVLGYSQECTKEIDPEVLNEGENFMVYE